jgi:hypothetical protein
MDANGDGRVRNGDQTETNRMHLVVLGMQNSAFGPYLAVNDRILISVMLEVSVPGTAPIWLWVKLRCCATCPCAVHQPADAAESGRRRSPKRSRDQRV